MTYKDIVRSITEKLNGVFPDVSVTSNDVSEGFKRPSFFMEFVAPRSTPISENRRKRTFTLRISYFPTSRTENDLELLEVQETLEQIFAAGLKISVGEDVLNTDRGTNCRVTDRVLHCDIFFETFETIERPVTDAEFIEDIHINVNMNS